VDSVQAQSAWQSAEGFVYVAFVMDAYSRRIVGRQTGDHLRTDHTIIPGRGSVPRDCPGVTAADRPCPRVSERESSTRGGASARQR
jgi:hypothetical protein